MFQGVDISSGISPAVSSLAGAPTRVSNWCIDAAGANTPRAGSAMHTVASFTSDEVIGIQPMGQHCVLVTESSTGVRSIWRVSTGSPNNAFLISSTSVSTSLLGGSSRPSFVVGAQYVYMTGGDQIRRWRPGMALVETLAASPQCTHIAALGQRLVANDVEYPMNFRWSDIGETVWSSWSAIDTQEADARPDDVIGVFETNRRLLIFGSDSTQVHDISSDPREPFSFMDALNVGMAAPHAAIKDDTGLYVLDSRRRIVKTDGSGVEVISQDIQSTLRGFDDISDTWGYREEINGNSYLVWCWPSEGVTLAYDLASGKWTERNFYLNGTQGNWPATCYAYWPALGYHLIGSSHPDGNLIRLDAGLTTDAGDAPILCDRMTGWASFGTMNKKRSARVRLIVKRGTAADNATPGWIECRVQNDNAPWSEWKSVSVGTPSDNAHTVDFHFGGVFVRRRYQIRYGSSERTTIAALYDDITELGVTL